MPIRFFSTKRSSRRDTNLFSVVSAFASFTTFSSFVYCRYVRDVPSESRKVELTDDTWYE